MGEKPALIVAVHFRDIIYRYKKNEEAVNIRTGNICERCGSAASDTGEEWILLDVFVR